ncbi:ATP-binding protein [Streptomyces sp. DSM 15324]|uniref:ATP-binding protein n=1 Tax=Streptomyces sp. DSM 15324 TaxID=1739111 RepID=UPI0007471129|nr:ATP-binding protein [Streptomyces sp. DSM 15324]KUO08465.1 AAA family ATPase [Streptomyces sp. DSM 15324]
MHDDGREVDAAVMAQAVADVLARLDAHARTTADGGAPGRLRRRSRHAASDTGDGGTPRDRHDGAPDDASYDEGALATVVDCFGLTPFERDLLVLCAAMELGPRAAAHCAAAGGRDFPTFSLALAALTEPHWSALTPDAPLRRYRLVEVAEEPVLTTARLRIDERVLHYLLGVSQVEPRLQGLVARAAVPGRLPASQARLAAELASAVSSDRVAALSGGDLQTRREVTVTAALAAGFVTFTMSAADLPAEPADRAVLARLWEREGVLLPAVLLVEVDGAAQAAAAEAFVAMLGVPVVLSGQDPLTAAATHRAQLVVEPLEQAEQRELWRAELDGRGGEADVAGLVAQFSLPGHVIRSAGAVARRAGGDVAEAAWRAGLAHARIALDELGRRVEPRAGWDDLVVPERQRGILREIVAHVRQRATVYQDWGFEDVLRRGLGVTALFAGGSGTGKTLAAEVVAGALGLDLFVIDLSQVVSKYIGETEKNLRRIFDAAERGGAVLLFDEADALFGKRSEVKDSHDRYANLEVSYLLMRMESYRGLAILTTNQKKALDHAFLRRLRFVVDFPFPDMTERAEIWRRVIPPRAPVDGVAVERLAQLTVAGGSIRNIALSAAFLAADEGTELRMRHLLAAAQTEYAKLERSVTSTEVAGWV